MIVVTGATGNVGRPLVRALAAAGERLRAVSRNPAGESLAGVEYRAADLADPESLPEVLAGADALFLLLAGDLLSGVPAPEALLDKAVASGVRRVVALSSQAAGTRPGAVSHEPLRNLERAVRASGLEWTVLRSGGFFTNAYAHAESVRSERMVHAPFGDVGLPFVDPADIADAAAAVLCQDGHGGRTYVLTGPEPSSPRQRAKMIGEAIGAEVGFVELTRGQAREYMLQQMPAAVAEGTLGILGEPTEEERQVSPDLETLLGRPGRTFSDWAVRHSAAFA
jgi:uncharacterized protein YbjT (DUF2867 family)